MVTTADDELDAGFDPADLSLREAIREANNRPAADTITFAPSLRGARLRLSLGQIQITDGLTITGLGAADTVIDAQGNSRIFEFIFTFGAAGDLTLDRLTLTGGRTTGDNLDNLLDTTFSGGAVRFQSPGTLTIRDSILSGNSTEGRFAEGGAVFSFGSQNNLVRSVVSGNSTRGDCASGGALSIQGGLSISECTVRDNSTQGAGAEGGAIVVEQGAGTVTSQ